MKRYIRATSSLTSNVLYNALSGIPGLEFVYVDDLEEIMGYPGYYYIVKTENNQYRVIGFTGDEPGLVLQEFNTDEDGNYTDPVDLEHLKGLPESDWDVITDWIENNEYDMDFEDIEGATVEELKKAQEAYTKRADEVGNQADKLKESALKRFGKKFIKSSRDVDPLVYWPNGVQCTTDDCIEALMAFYGEDYKAAKQDLWAINLDKLQSIIDWYSKNYDDLEDYYR